MRIRYLAASFAPGHRAWSWRGDERGEVAAGDAWIAWFAGVQNRVAHHQVAHVADVAYFWQTYLESRLVTHVGWCSVLGKVFESETTIDFV